MKKNKFQKVSNFLKDIINENLKQKSFIYNNIFNNWNQIVGDDISSITIPSHLKFIKNKNIEAILTIKVHAMLIPELHLKSENIRTRINFFYGLDTIKKIKISKSYDTNLLKKLQIK